MTNKNADLLYPELSYKIVGAVYAVWKNLGSGYKEVVYQKALEREFENRGLCFTPQKIVPIIYEGKKVGAYTPDFVVDEKIILELKHLPQLTFREKKQIWHYLKGTEYKLLILVNFGGRDIEIIRWVYDKARHAKRRGITR